MIQAPEFFVDRRSFLWLNNQLMVTDERIDMSGMEQILEESAVFSRMTPEGKHRLAGGATKRRIREGEVLAKTGETASFFFVLGSGTVLLSMGEGRALVLNTPGDFIAMELLSAAGVYKSTVTALCDGFVYVVQRGTFLEMIREDSADAEEVVRAWRNYLEQTAPFVKTQEYNADGFEYAY